MGLWADYLRVVSAIYGWSYSHLAVIGEGLKNVLMGQSVWWVRSTLAFLFLALAIWSLRLSKDYVMEGAPHITRWNDPRRWAAVVLFVLVALYLFL